MSKPETAADLRERLERFKNFYRDSGPRIPDCVPVTLDLERLAGPNDLTVGDLREAAAALSHAEQAQARLEQVLPADVRADECSPAVYYLRMVRQGYSYDAQAGIWWKDDDKPGVLVQAERACATLREALSEVLALFPYAELLDELDDPDGSGKRKVQITATFADVRRWRAALARVPAAEEQE